MHDKRRPRAWWEWMPESAPPTPTPSITAQDEVRSVGILDASSRPIMRGPNPIGFPITRKAGEPR